MSAGSTRLPVGHSRFCICFASRLGVIAVQITGLLRLLVTVSLVLGLAHPALAEIGDISIGGVWVCRLTKGAGGLTLEQRVEQVERNMYAVVNNPRYRGRRTVPVSVRVVGQGAAIMVDDLVILVVTPEDVSGTGAKPIEAAQQWAQRMAKGLAQALPDPTQQGL
ncbi:MAG: hypothetical protein ACT4P5_17805 [Armatimonadota bacterium]